MIDILVVSDSLQYRVLGFEVKHTKPLLGGFKA
jgi:hypothetical protein